MVDEEGNFGILAYVLIGAIIGLGMSYASNVVSNAQDGFEWSDLNTFEDNWKSTFAQLLEEPYLELLVRLVMLG